VSSIKPVNFIFFKIISSCGMGTAFGMGMASGMGMSFGFSFCLNQFELNLFLFYLIKQKYYKQCTK